MMNDVNVNLVQRTKRMFVSMFSVKNNTELQTLERFLVDEQNRAKIVRHLFYK